MPNTTSVLKLRTPLATEENNPPAYTQSLAQDVELAIQPQPATAKTTIPAPRFAGDVARVASAANSDENGLYDSFDGSTWVKRHIIASSLSRLNSVFPPSRVGQDARVSGSSTASENGRYVSLDGTSWMKDGAIAQFSLGSAQTIAANNSTPFALAAGAINELGATISGTNVTIPAGRYLVTAFVQLDVPTAGTWINMTLNGSNVQFIGGQNVEMNSPTGYTSLRGTFHVIAGSGAALSATLTPNNSLSQRLAGYLTIQRIG